MFNTIPGSNTDIKNLKKELSLDDSLNVISTRSFFPIYDIETLVRAIPDVIEKVPDAKFILKGHEPRAGMGQFKEK